MMLNDFHVVERHSKRKDVFILKCVPFYCLCVLFLVHVCSRDALLRTHAGLHAGLLHICMYTHNSLTHPSTYPSSSPPLHARTHTPLTHPSICPSSPRYEHLKETRKRMAILRKLINFLRTCFTYPTWTAGVCDDDYTLHHTPLTTPLTTSRTSTDLDAPDPARLACADVLGDRPDTHRIKASNAITREEVYTPEVACMMWLIFGERVKKLGYGLPPWVSKEECAAVKYDWSKLMLPRRLRVKQKQAALAMEVGKEAEKGKGKDEAAARKEEGSAKGQVEKRYSK